MRFQELRRTLHRIVLAGLPAIALAACDASGSPDHMTKVVRIPTPASPAVQQLLNACATGDRAACEQLCFDFLCSQPPYFGDMVSCELSHDGTDAVLTIGYEGVQQCPAVGRRPAGLCPPAGAHAHVGAVGAWLAHAAHLEAASVHAFVALARELLHHDAPAPLCRAALVAAQDEVAHAAMMNALAARYGAAPLAVHVEPQPLRSLEALALENAIEGCVRETWGALHALYQARAARDPQVRAVMARIAADELRHATLAWAVDRWAQPQLDPAARRRVSTARLAAAAELVGAPASPLDATLVEHLGLPDVLHARRLLVDAHAAVWS